MPFQIHPIKEFLVRPALPASISRLNELAYNLVWSWDHALRALFHRLEPVLWKTCKQNTILMLGRIPQAVLEKAAADPRYLAVYLRACAQFEAYMAAEGPRRDELIADFSM